MRDYKLYIDGYKWRARANRYIASLYNSRCECCNDKMGQQVHHQNYKSLDYNNPGTELDEDLLYVCDGCHTGIHNVRGYHSSKQSDMDAGLRSMKQGTTISRPVPIGVSTNQKESTYVPDNGGDNFFEGFFKGLWMIIVFAFFYWVVMSIGQFLFDTDYEQPKSYNSSELNAYSEKLKEELNDIMYQDYCESIRGTYKRPLNAVCNGPDYTGPLGAWSCKTGHKEVGNTCVIR